MPNLNPTAPASGLADALAKASFELAFAPPRRLGPARAAIVLAHWMSPHAPSSRTALIGADLSRLASGSGDAGAVASAMAFKLRAGLLASGAAAATGYCNDFPSAPFMASADVASCSCAVGWPASMGLDDMLRASLHSLDGMFQAGALRWRHVKSSAPNGSLARAANQIVMELRRDQAPRSAPAPYKDLAT